MTSITPSPEMVERAKQSVLSEMSDRRLLNDVDDDLHDEIAAAIVQACLPALSCPDGFRLVPVEPTQEMLDRAVAFALNVTLSGDYNWSAYMRDVWRTMLAASPAPAVDNAGWRPIETAPKEGTEILLFTSHRRDDFGDAFDAVQIGYWDKGNIGPGVHPVFHREPGWHLQKIGIPTHWQPLPSAPSQPLTTWPNPPTRHRTE